MEYEKIVGLIHEVEDSDITEFELQKGEFRVSIKRQGTSGLTVHREAACEKEEHTEVLVEEGTMIRSPFVGIFHAPDGRDGGFKATIGARVEEGQILGAIEAMKLMNDVAACCSGTITEILVSDGALVEYGQPLYVIGG